MEQLGAADHKYGNFNSRSIAWKRGSLRSGSKSGSALGTPGPDRARSSPYRATRVPWGARPTARTSAHTGRPRHLRARRIVGAADHKNAGKPMRIHTESTQATSKEI
jgi:hypothetical protein